MAALPGPPSLPLVGNLTQMMGYKRPQTHIVWTKWARQYGKLYRFGLLCVLRLHLRHSLSIEAVTRTSDLRAHDGAPR